MSIRPSEGSNRSRPRNPFLDGNFAPVRSEDDYPDLRVLGALPRELNGTYYRNGSNPAFDPPGRYHLFDGDGMIHAVTIRDGRASYRNRFVESAGLEQERRAGRALYQGIFDLGTDGERAPRFKNTANTNIVQHAGRLLALVETAHPTELEPRTLETLGIYDFDGKLDTPMTAHPKFDPESGEMLFFGYSLVASYLTLHVVDAGGRLIRSEEIDIAWPSMIHDFAITREHVVFLLFPLVFDLAHMRETGSPFRWEPDRGTRIGVMPRSGSNADVRWYQTDASYVFHPMNAFEHGRELVIDVARFGELVFMDPNASRRPPRPEVNPRLHRWRVDLESGDVHSEPLDDRIAEYPRIDERLVGRPYRYGYTVGAGNDPTWYGYGSAIYKYDLLTGRQQTHDFGGGNGCGEPVFVPRDSEVGEDDGVVLTFVYDRARDRSDLVVLDARNVADSPLARIEIPRRVPYGFHGNWVPEN